MQITNDGIELMEKLGGSFVRSLAEAWYHADGVNKAKLEKNFPYLRNMNFKLKEQRNEMTKNEIYKQKRLP